MYKWKIDISLKSGQNISGLYEGPETNSFDVGKLLLENNSNITVFAIMSLDNMAQLFIMRADVSAMAISIFDNNIDNQNAM